MLSHHGAPLNSQSERSFSASFGQLAESLSGHRDTSGQAVSQCIMHRAGASQTGFCKACNRMSRRTVLESLGDLVPPTFFALLFPHPFSMSVK